MPKRFHSTLILVVVFGLGLAAGIGGMVWAWPGVHARYFRHRRETSTQYLQRTLKLTAGQVPQVQAVFKDTGQRVHAIHLQFVPAYNKICDEFNGVRHQEMDSFAPVRQQELDKLHAIMTASQWQSFQQHMAAQSSNRSHHQADLCGKHQSAPGAAPHPGPPPGH